MKNLSKFQLKKMIVDMVCSGGAGHIPSAFSIFDIVYTLYHGVLNLDIDNHQSDNRDYFILSKGHGCLALYVNLYDIGLLSDRTIEEFCQPGGILGEHPDMTKVPGVEASTGSLGHGLSFACGVSFALARKNMTNQVYVLVGDGECHEGSVWEAANLATNLNLNRLTAIVDLNQSATQLLKVDNQIAKWSGFGWNVISEIDGHNNEELHRALRIAQAQPGPSVVLARTEKGKGSTLISGHGPWHHKIPNEQERTQIIEELKIES